MNNYVVLHTCFKWNRIFDTALFVEQTGIRVTNDMSNADIADQSLRKLQGKVTVGQVLQYTPKVKEVIEGCSLRQAGDGLISTFDNGGCNERIKVGKYLSNDEVCYTHEFLNPRYWLEMVGFNPTMPHVFSSIIFNSKLFQFVDHFSVFYTIKGMIL